MSKFDWLVHMPSTYTATEREGRLIVDYTRDTIELIRFPPIFDLYWMLGFYQAEGGKKSVLEWTIVSSTPRLLRACVEALEALGLTRDRMYMQIRYAPGDDAEATRSMFEIEGVVVRSLQARTPHRKTPKGNTWKHSGKRGAVLHVARSAALYRMVMSALNEIHSHGYTFPSQHAARAYSIGWLDGDGGVKIGPKMFALGLYGTEEEIAVVDRALAHGFSGDSKGGAHKKHSSLRALSVIEAAKLAVAGCFRFSMNRARLLYGLEKRGRLLWSLRDGLSKPQEIRRCACRQGWATADLKMTPAAREAVTRFAAVSDELAALRTIIDPESLGHSRVKCEPYPEALVPFGIAAFEKERPATPAKK